MNKVLIVIDCQNDFIDGALRNEEAIKKVPAIADYIKKFDGKIICTQDTHYENYFETLEGKKLPIKHCIFGSDGWKINTEILKACLCKDNADTQFIKKETFGSITKLKEVLDYCGEIEPIDEIIIMGFVTNICVLNNFCIIRAYYPNVKITVIENCCAGTSLAEHNAAILMMKSGMADIL